MAAAGILPAADIVAQEDRPQVLERIHEPGLEMAVWRRALPELAAGLDGLADEHLPEARILVEARAPEPAIAAMLAGKANVAGLAEDIGLLVRLFGRIAGEEKVDLRLEPVAGDGCWKFHRDCVRLRLLVTYRGPGTQWVDPADSAAALAGQRDYAGPLRHLRRFDAALFKGDRAGAGRGIVHRSPPAAARAGRFPEGRARLLLCLNPPEGFVPRAYSKP